MDELKKKTHTHTPELTDGARNTKISVVYSGSTGKRPSPSTNNAEKHRIYWYLYVYIN